MDKKLKSVKRAPGGSAVFASARTARIILYLRRVGAVSIILGCGALLMLGPDGFLPFAVMIYIAIVILAADLLLEMRGSSRNSQITVVVGALMVIAIISWQFVFVRLPVGMIAYSSNVDYLPGDAEYGIQWSPRFTDLQLTIANDTGYDYSQLDLLIKPKEPVVTAAILPDSAPASIIRQMLMMNVDFQLYRPSMNRRFAIPTTCWASTGGFRLRADLLPSNAHITVVLALANIDESKTNNSDYYMGPWGIHGDKFWYRWENRSITDDLFKLRPTPWIASITGSYVAFYRRKRIDETVPVISPMNNVINQLRSLKK